MINLDPAYKSKLLEVYDNMRKDMKAPTPILYTYNDGLFGLEFRLDMVNGPKGYPYMERASGIRWEKLLGKYAAILRYDGIVIVDFRSTDAPDSYAVTAFTTTLYDHYEIFKRR